MNIPADTRVQDPLPLEDRARANMYALISRLFYAPPDPGLLAQIAQTMEPAGDAKAITELTLAWRTLQEVSASAVFSAVKLEYDTLFVGVGKAEVTPYTSHYMRSAPDVHLVALREQLKRWGLTRGADVFEVEDHISGLCDVMRFLIEQCTPVADQRWFFERFVAPGALPLLNAIAASPTANFYRQVVPFARTFFELEKTTYEMEEVVPATY
jgi:TorA maturation chaperone TorD